MKLGIDTEMHSEVAIKIYDKAKILNSSKKRAIEREIEALQTLQHPNIIKLVNVIENVKSVKIFCFLRERFPDQHSI